MKELFLKDNGELNDLGLFLFCPLCVAFLFSLPWMFAHFLKWAYGM